MKLISQPSMCSHLLFATLTATPDLIALLIAVVLDSPARFSPRLSQPTVFQSWYPPPDAICNSYIAGLTNALLLKKFRERELVVVVRAQGESNDGLRLYFLNHGRSRSCQRDCEHLEQVLLQRGANGRLLHSLTSSPHWSSQHPTYINTNHTTITVHTSLLTGRTILYVLKL